MMNGTHVSHISAASAEFSDDESPTGVMSDISDKNPESLTVERRVPKHVRRDHNVASLAKLAKAAKQEEQAIRREIKAKQAMLAKIAKAREAVNAARRDLYDIDAKVNGEHGQRWIVER